MAEESPVTIEQVTGPKRIIVLKGRARPYRPLEFTRVQRVQTTYLPANPKANQQVVGSKFEPTTITGTWKDRFLLANSPTKGVDLLNFPPLGPNAIPQSALGGTTFIGTAAFPGVQPALLARVVHDAFDLMVAEGQEIRFQWDQIVRYGIIRRYTPRFGEPTGGIDSIGWELEFEWNGDVEIPPIMRPVSLNVLAIAAGLSALLRALLEAIEKVSGLAQPNKFLAQVAAVLGQIVALVAALVDAFNKLVAFITLPSDLLATIRSSLQAIKLLVQGLLQDLQNLRSASGEAAQIGELSAVMIAALIQQELRARIMELAAFAAEQQRIAALFDSDEVQATFFANAFTSLRDVATQFYGDPSEWTRISDYNAFYSAVVPRGTLVRVPRIT